MPGPTTVLLDEISPTLHLDGYRPYRAVDGTNVKVGIAAYLGGEQVGAQILWDGDDPIFEARVLRVITVICRFLNTATSDAECLVFKRLAASLFRLPSLTYTGLKYLAARNDETDVVFDIPGDDRVLRVVEDKFAEVLDVAQLSLWGEQKREEEEDEDG